ncbi:alpha/beta hydrolase [Actinomadura flavalba]|uniref:alpha/beta hydrolase n=1 Tax=Actinomadura flavalba TaxID=1120938 RepID=UPI00037A8201|nr:alpha/beta hydrolase [Actinomadura flavalba]
MSLDPQTERYVEQLRGFTAMAEHGGAQPSIHELREQLDLVFPVERRDLPRVEDLRVPGTGGEIPVRLYRPEPDGAPLPVLVYLHGGGWVVGGIEAMDVSCRELAAGAGCVVLNVGYRLAPEHPYPAAAEDTWSVIAAVLADPARFGADPGRVAVGGDSAGGNLAAVAALRARDTGVPLVHQLLVYPVTDTARDTESWAQYGSGYGLDADQMSRFMEMYRAGADPCEPGLAPLHAPDLSGVAPATVITAEYDILRDEGEAYAARLAAAGVPVEARRYPGVVHSFFLMPDTFDAGRDAQALAVARLREAFGTPG